MRILKMIQVRFLAALLALSLLTGGTALFAASSSAKQLEKGIQLYQANQDEAAMDYLIDVLVNGSRAEVEEANKYINLIHNRMGGIQDPVEVDVNFKEGEARRLQPGQDPAVLEAQMNAENAPIENYLDSEGLTYTAEQDAVAMKGQEEAEMLAAQEQARQQALLQQQAQQRALEAQMRSKDRQVQEADVIVEAPGQSTQQETASTGSTFTDLSTPSALKARQIYTSQKLDSMKKAAIAKLEKAEGVRVYFRDGLPDAIDIDSDVLFNGYKFRPEAMPLLDEIYTLMALTQGAGYVILPPGSYTDNITLAGIRQAMALNSFLVHKGLSSGKLSYNMGLFDQEPPAKFANLDGVSIVFDFDSELPASMPQAASVSKLPLLSMAVVPVSNEIDPAAGEAFAIDFSVIETAETIDNWLFQVVQHAANGGYYVVRQLEGFSPVYHQLVWNGRKGIIGPELACGTYTLALTATDVMGGKRTIRRQIEVACTNAQPAQKATASTQDKKLNYKTARLWNKPARIMKSAPAQQAEPEIVDPFATENTATQAADAYAMQNSGVTDPYAAYGAGTTDPYAVPAASAQGGVTNPYAAPAAQGGVTNPYAAQQPAAGQAPAQGVTNPYDMPYEEYGK